MAVKEWSDNILLAEMQDDPLFSEDMNLLQELVEQRPGCHLVMDMSNISFLNSSNIAQLLKVRKALLTPPAGKLRLCGINTHVWGVFLTTGLDKVFECCDNVASGLASVQLEA